VHRRRVGSDDRDAVEARMQQERVEREKARQASEDLLKDVPASPLAREATRTLAIAAWGDGSYRLAATHLTTLADSSVEPERAGLRIAAADCLFLAKDFVLAEKAYANLQQEAADIRLSEDAFHQRVYLLGNFRIFFVISALQKSALSGQKTTDSCKRQRKA
jgi:hypothetical protein